MTKFSKVLVVFIAAASIAFMAFAGAIGFEDAVRIVDVRGRAMQ